MVSISHPAPKTQDDYDLQRRIAHALLTLRAPRFAYLHTQSTSSTVQLRFSRTRLVQVDARNGRVTLTGHIPSGREKELVASLVAHIPGVLEVIDQIAVVDHPRLLLPSYAA